MFAAGLHMNETATLSSIAYIVPEVSQRTDVANKLNEC